MTTRKKSKVSETDESQVVVEPRARKVFRDPDTALKYMHAALETLDDIDIGIVDAEQGVDGDVTFGESYQTSNVVVAFAKAKQSDEYTHALLFPIPRIEDSIPNFADLAEPVQSLLNDVWVKEICHRAQRPTRNIIHENVRGEQFLAAVGEISTTIEALTTKRAGGSTPLYEAFNALVEPTRKGLMEVPSWAACKLTKDLLRQAFSNAAFARVFYPKQERKGHLVKVLEYMIATAQEQGLEPGILQTWYTTRDDQEYHETPVPVSKPLTGAAADLAAMFVGETDDDSDDDDDEDDS